MKYKCESGYHNKKDSMRDEAKKLLKGDTNVKVEGYYPSKSAPQFEKRRPYKEGGYVKGGKVKTKNKELHISEPIMPKKPKSGLRVNRKEGFEPKYKKGGMVKEIQPAPIRAGKHPMIGTKKKPVSLAHGKKGKINSKVKVKSSLPYDASHGAYMRRGGKVKKGS